MTRGVPPGNTCVGSARLAYPATCRNAGGRPQRHKLPHGNCAADRRTVNCSLAFTSCGASCAGCQLTTAFDDGAQPDARPQPSSAVISTF